MAIVSESHITFRWKQVIQYVTSITCYSVREIAISAPYYLLSSGLVFFQTTITN